MSQLAELIQSEEDFTNALDGDYQAKMYVIEEAMRELGHADKPEFQKSPFDAALLQLIDAVPME